MAKVTGSDGRTYDLGDIEQRRRYWTLEAARQLVGASILRAEYAPDAEFGSVLILTLSNGTRLVPLADDEGNGPGAVQIMDGNRAYLLPVVG